jgi:hypothetical protein
VEGLTRDNFGTRIKGFAINIGYCSSIQTELWAIIYGLELA